MPEKKSKAQGPSPKVRKLKQPRYRSFKVSKTIRQPKPALTGSFRLLARSLRLLYKNWRLFGGITGIYLVLNIILVKGFAVSNDINQLKDNLLQLSQGGSTQLSTSFTVFRVLLSDASTPPNEVAGAYQSMLLLIISLAIIWALRQTSAAKKTKLLVRDAFYKGLYPLAPFILVTLVIGLQLLPLLIASFLYSVVFTGGLAVTAIEKVLWILLMSLMGLLSLYMVSSSLFALYIATLSDVRPVQALKSARELVRHRRWMIARKLVFLPIALFVLAAIIIVPAIIIWPLGAEWLFFGLSMLTPAVVHSYIYGVYRELL